MQEIVLGVGWFFIVTSALGAVIALGLTVSRLFLRSRPSQMVGAELPVTHEGIDLSRRYDLAYGAGHGVAGEKMFGVRILGYLRSDRDQTTGEYMDSRWLVVELADGRRAYLRPRSVLWLVETESS